MLSARPRGHRCLLSLYFQSPPHSQSELSPSDEAQGSWSDPPGPSSMPSPTLPARQVWKVHLILDPLGGSREPHGDRPASLGTWLSWKPPEGVWGSWVPPVVLPHCLFLSGLLMLANRSCHATEFPTEFRGGSLCSSQKLTMGQRTKEQGWGGCDNCQPEAWTRGWAARGLAGEGQSQSELLVCGVWCLRVALSLPAGVRRRGHPSWAGAKTGSRVCSRNAG